MQENMNKVADIKKTIIINAPIQKVWDKVSNAEGIAAWFMPNDFKPELNYQFSLQSPFGPSPCKVLEINPPNYLSFSWDESGWLVSFELKDLNGKTEFTLIHSGWKSPEEIILKTGQKNSEIREKMNNGWDSIVKDRLNKLFEG